MSECLPDLGFAQYRKIVLKIVFSTTLLVIQKYFPIQIGQIPHFLSIEAYGVISYKPGKQLPADSEKVPFPE
jgi:hypothetical protein